MSRAVTILVIDDQRGANPSLVKKHLQDTAGAPCQVEIVAAGGGSAAVNQAMRDHPHDDIVWTIPGLRIETGGWLPRFQARSAADSQCGVVGAKIFDRIGLIYSCGRLIVSPFGLHDQLANIGHGESDAAPFQRFAEVDAVLPWLCFLRREAIDAAGGIDELWSAIAPGPDRPTWLETDDFCLSVRARGFSVYVEPAVCATHPGAAVDDKLEALYQKATSSALEPLDNRVINLWRKKWRWHPGHPDLRAVRDKWLKTPICWRVGASLLDDPESSDPRVDIVMVTRNNLALLRKAMESLAKTKYPSIRLFIHLNGSTDGSRAYLNELQSTYPFPIYLAEVPVNIGHAPAVNWLLQMSDAPLIAKLDDDIELEPDWLARLAGRLRDDPYAGAVGAKVVEMGDPTMIQWADYQIWPRPDCHQRQVDRGQFDYLSRTIGNMGCCILYRRKAVMAAGPYDISLNPNSWDDLDHQIALWKCGYEVLYDGHVRVKHPYKPLREQCRRALGNTLGNGYKVAIKWGPGALQALDEGLEASGRRIG
ncbi:MAG TPA: glycosyltransferase [Candidatus Methylacidiphilales bacterium]